MLGWWIGIAEVDPEEYDRVTPEQRRAALLARWEVGLNGLDWVEDLVAAGKAEQLLRGGYPSRYAARAEHVLPLLAEGAVPGSGAGQLSRVRALETHPERIAACPADRALTIEVWDQS
ncbi:hypothetical protein PUR71_07825 [Streptomyces sp. SP17BM10]|uniref:hypothetical protein n=1 Tax=Streptomyces sp. SP17BM10 TaxID=3002530 RepID=UPI002E75FF87|nr:hypothetical protein [Streptomyces sp. SP17BM10]MEE1782822.1 hypothetical protein [Streptomyces sp. SP17BM10]